MSSKCDNEFIILALIHKSKQTSTTVHSTFLRLFSKCFYYKHHYDVHLFP